MLFTQQNWCLIIPSEMFHRFSQTKQRQHLKELTTGQPHLQLSSGWCSNNEQDTWGRWWRTVDITTSSTKLAGQLLGKLVRSSFNFIGDEYPKIPAVPFPNHQNNTWEYKILTTQNCYKYVRKNTKTENQWHVFGALESLATKPLTCSIKTVDSKQPVAWPTPRCLPQPSQFPRPDRRLRWQQIAGLILNWKY